MGDNPVQGNYLVEANVEVKKKWLDIEIQSRISRIARHKQDIEDLIKGKIVDLEAKIMMLERELESFKEDRKRLDAPPPVVINVDKGESK
jgi:hypothetical protein